MKFAWSLQAQHSIPIGIQGATTSGLDSRRHRFVPWFVGVAAGAALLLSVRAMPAASLEMDAASLSRGGVWVLGRLEASPGSPDSCGLALDFATLYWGTDLTLGGLHAQHRVAGAVVAASLSQLRSPVGVETTWRGAVQVSRGGVRGGVGLMARSLRLVSLPGAWDFSPRAGLGFAAGGFEAVSALELDGAGWSQAQIAAVVSARLERRITFLVQVGWTTGAPEELRAGIEWGDGALRWRSGYDTAAATCSVGFEWHLGAQSFAWAARTHPELGWSHAWTWARP